MVREDQPPLTRGHETRFIADAFRYASGMCLLRSGFSGWRSAWSLRCCNRPLWVRYDLELVKREFPKKALFGRPPTLWRYLELLPMEDPANIVSLTETITPILPAKRLGAEFGLENLLIKDESRLPTGSFKARGMAMAVTMANELGLKRLAAPTAGNAGVHWRRMQLGPGWSPGCSCPKIRR